MTGKQQIEQEQLRATRPITIRALSILAAVAALALTAAPVGSALHGPSSGSVAFKKSGSSGAANGGLAPSGIIMRDGGVCDPIRHMGC